MNRPPQAPLEDPNREIRADLLTNQCSRTSAGNMMRMYAVELRERADKIEKLAKLADGVPGELEEAMWEMFVRSRNR